MTHKHTLKNLQDRRDVRGVACPACGVLPGEKCLGNARRIGGMRYVRSASHTERWTAWRESESRIKAGMVELRDEEAGVIRLRDYIQTLDDCYATFGENATIDELGISAAEVKAVRKRLVKKIDQKLNSMGSVPRLPDRAKVVHACGLPEVPRDYMVVRRNPYKDRMDGDYQFLHLIFNVKTKAWLNPATGNNVDKVDFPILAYWIPEHEL